MFHHLTNKVNHGEMRYIQRFLWKCVGWNDSTLIYNFSKSHRDSMWKESGKIIIIEKSHREKAHQHFSAPGTDTFSILSFILHEGLNLKRILLPLSFTLPLLDSLEWKKRTSSIANTTSGTRVRVPVMWQLKLNMFVLLFTTLFIYFYTSLTITEARVPWFWTMFTHLPCS